jgi:hypothetical protein
MRCGAAKPLQRIFISWAEPVLALRIRRRTVAFNQPKRSDMHAVDWFIPASLRTDVASLGRMRIFVVSHLIGPFLGALIMIYLYRIEPNRDLHFWIVVITPAMFWLLPLLLKLTGRPQLVALLSVLDLTFVSLYGSYFYGGVSSPFLVWALVALLLGFFYLGERKATLLLVFGGFGLAFSAGYLLTGGSDAHHAECGGRRRHPLALLRHDLHGHDGGLLCQPGLPAISSGTGGATAPRTDRAVAAEEGGRRAGQPGQDGVPGQDEPPTAHPAERGDRLQRDPARGRTTCQ